MIGLDKISDKDFVRFCDFIYQRCGITMNENKRDLVHSRLAKRLRNVSGALLKKYFSGNRDGSRFRVHEKLASYIKFARLNLMHDFPFKNRFDCIFCRNVMIYFDRQTQGQLVNKFSSFLNPGGYLMIGHSESLTNVKHDLVYVQPSLYRKKS